MTVLATFDRKLPARWNKQKDIADAVIKYHFFSEKDYWCDSCTVIRELPRDEVKAGKMLFMKCSSEEEGMYYLGCIGPFDEEGFFDPDRDQSVYYTTAQTEAEFEAILQQFIEYINSQ